MRIAWIGPAPSSESGAQYLATQLLQGLSARGVEIDCYMTGTPAEIPTELRSVEGLRLICERPRWEWNRWYSRTPLSQMITGAMARSRAHGRLAARIVDQQPRRGYDLVYQFSHIELLSLRGLRDRLPPIVVHPGVHAAGELRWQRSERRLVRQSPVKHAGISALLAWRAREQRRDIHAARHVIALSRHFAADLESDYRYPRSRMTVVPNCVDLNRFPGSSPSRPRTGPVRLLFASRISARKGTEMVTALSHRVADLAGLVHIEVVGGASQWSDYRSLLQGLNPQTASYSGELSAVQMVDAYLSADLTLVPSHYEPFGLTAAESLACGTPVLASEAVGAVEEVDQRCAPRFAPGDLDGLEALVRTHVKQLQTDRLNTGMRRMARAEAERVFDPGVIAAALQDALSLVVTPG